MVRDPLCFTHILTNDFLRAVTATVEARKITIKGKRGTVIKDFSHVSCEIKKMKQDTKRRVGTFIRIRIWFGGYKQSCAVNTLKTLIGNMIIGVTEVSIVGQTIAFSPFLTGGWSTFLCLFSF